MIENDEEKMTGFNGTVKGWDHRGKGVRVGMRRRVRVRGLFCRVERWLPFSIKCEVQNLEEGWLGLYRPLNHTLTEYRRLCSRVPRRTFT